MPGGKTVKRVNVVFHVILLICVAIAALVFINIRRRHIARQNLKYVQLTLESQILAHDPSVTADDARMLLPNGEGTDVEKGRPWPEARLARYRQAMEILRGRDDIAKPFLYNLTMAIPAPEVYNVTNWRPGALPLNLGCYWVQRGFEVKACQVVLRDADRNELQRLHCPIPRQTNPYLEGSQNHLYLELLHHCSALVLCTADRNIVKTQDQGGPSNLLLLSSAALIEVSLISTDNKTSNSVEVGIRRIRDFLAASLGSKQALLGFVSEDYEDPDWRDWIAFLLSRHNILGYERPAKTGTTQAEPTGTDIREFILGHKDSLMWDEAHMKWVIAPRSGPASAE
ncbi:MAG: hypothetical protein J7M19_08085 [Planctomycetes bacterium]|nr:hypothetical protein [Planctomycetota bacterium]